MIQTSFDFIYIFSEKETFFKKLKIMLFFCWKIQKNFKEENFLQSSKNFLTLFFFMKIEEIDLLLKLK
jgi:hypothetical protein